MPPSRPSWSYAFLRLHARPRIHVKTASVLNGFHPATCVTILYIADVTPHGVAKTNRTARSVPKASSFFLLTAPRIHQARLRPRAASNISFARSEARVEADRTALRSARADVSSLRFLAPNLLRIRVNQHLVPVFGPVAILDVQRRVRPSGL
jgi:hypothetical protein